MLRLDSKIALITGGGSGIGRAVSQLFARQGAEVHILDINDNGATETVEAIIGGGGTASYHRCDVSQQAEVASLVKTLDHIDILVNNAGVAHVGTAESTELSDFQRIFDINVKGVYNCIHEVIPKMKAQGGGVITNLCSIAALVGITDRFAYSMSKGAVYAMTLSVARDYLQHNIRCNSVSPARVHTPFVDGFISKNYPGRESEIFEKLSRSQPIGRMGTVDEVATAILYLSSPEAGFITGCDYPVDGGFLKLNN